MQEHVFFVLCFFCPCQTNLAPVKTENRTRGLEPCRSHSIMPVKQAGFDLPQNFAGPSGNANVSPGYVRTSFSFTFRQQSSLFCRFALWLARSHEWKNFKLAIQGCTGWEHMETIIGCHKFGSHRSLFGQFEFDPNMFSHDFWMAAWGQPTIRFKPRSISSWPAHHQWWRIVLVARSNRRHCGILTVWVDNYWEWCGRVTPGS